MDQTDRPSQVDSTASLPQMVRLPAVLQATGLSRTTIYRMVAAHTFPAPVRLAKRAVGWLLDDLLQWIAARLGSSR
jgi:prophage regulatory protein